MFILSKEQAKNKPLLKLQIYYIIKELKKYNDSTPKLVDSFDIERIRDFIKVLENIVGENSNRDDDEIKLISLILSFFIGGCDGSNSESIQPNDDNLQF